MAEQVARWVRMWLLTPTDRPLHSVWRYRPGDPWAVHVEFAAGTADAVQCVFGRELLARGLHAPAGLGDVQIFPYRGRIAVGLEGEGARSLMTARRADLARFLAAAYRLIPKGREAEHLDVDAVLARVMEEAERC